MAEQTAAPGSFYRRIDAVVRAKGNDPVTWVLKDNSYVRYDMKENHGFDGYPKLIEGNWPGLVDSFGRRIDAALNRRDQPNVVYLFKDSQYVRYDLDSDKVEPGYPLSIAEGWKGLPPDFQLGIDAAVNHQSNPNVSWFFKDDLYVRYDVVNDKLLGGPTPILRGWRGLPENFQRGIDAAVNSVLDTDKVYLFKDDQYVRFDLVGDKTDNGYPLPIEGNWNFFA